MNKEYASLEELFNCGNCAGWIVKNYSNDKYFYQNSNDLGLMGEVSEATEKELIIDKIEIKKGLFVYELYNQYECDFEDAEIVNGKEEAIEEIKECWK